MPKLAALRLGSPDPERQKRFYLEVLGMREREDGMIGYADEEIGLLFEWANSGYVASTEDLYWKISISVPDIELACRQLTDLGVHIDGPRQFGEVGFLAHLVDPLGFHIELICHWFEGDRPERIYDARLLGGGPHVSLLTLRCHDISLIHQVATELEMTRLCIVPVLEHGFTLYFYGYAGDSLPNSDLHALEARTWVYRRPYTVLEVLHREQDHAMLKRGPGQAGYKGAQVTDLGRLVADEHLLISAR